MGAGSGSRFPRASRLTSARHFRRVFASPDRSSDRFFTVLANPNGATQSRLGLAIAKKYIKQATARNRIKRVVRESFRGSQKMLGGLDLVVLARTDTGTHGNALLRDSLAKHWRRVSRHSTK